MENPRDYTMPGNQDPATEWPSSIVLLSAIAAATTRSGDRSPRISRSSALDGIPEQMAMGFTTFRIKPSIFIDDRAAHAAFCREVVDRLSQMS